MTSFRSEQGTGRPDLQEASGNREQPALVKTEKRVSTLNEARHIAMEGSKLGAVEIFEPLEHISYISGTVFSGVYQVIVGLNGHPQETPDVSRPYAELEASDTTAKLIVQSGI